MRKLLLCIFLAGGLLVLNSPLSAQSCSYAETGCVIYSAQAGSTIYACVGSEVQLSATSQSASVTGHTWSVARSGSDPIDGTVTLYPGTCAYMSKRTITVSAGTTQYTVYPSCSSSTILTITIIGQNGPSVAFTMTPSTTNPLDYCEGQSVTLTASNAVAPFRWFKTVGGTTDEITVNTSNSSISVSSSGIYKVQAVNSCNFTQEFSQEVRFNPVLSGVGISGLSSVCADIAATSFSVTGFNVKSYSWAISDTDPNNNATIAAVPDGNGVATSANVTWNGIAGAATLTLTAYGCNGTTSVATKTVSITPLPTQCSIATTSSVTACAGSYIMSAQSTSADVTSHKWFTTQTGGTEISGITHETQFGALISKLPSQSFTQTTTYWVEPQCACNATGTRLPVTFTLDPGSNIGATLTPNGLVPTDICANDAAVRLNGSGSLAGIYQWRIGDPNKAIPDSESASFRPTLNGTYYVRGVDNCGNWKDGNSITITIVPNISGLQWTSTPASFCSGKVDKVKLSLSGENVSYYTWNVTSPGKQPEQIGIITGGSTASQEILFDPTFTGPLNVTVTAHGCSQSTSQLSASPMLTVFTHPEASIQGSSLVNVSFGTNYTTLETTVVGGNSYQWYSGYMLLGSGGAIDIKASGEYNLIVTDTHGCVSGSDPVTVVFEGGYNVIKKHVLTSDVNQSGTQITEAEVAGLPASRKMTTLSYVDGLGRLWQSISKESSPSQKDIIQPIVYDALSREVMKYLPYSDQQSTGWLRLNVLGTSGYSNSVHAQFYNAASTAVAVDSKPYSVSVLEASPVGRPLQQGAPGADWQPEGNHKTVIEYRTNDVNEVLQIFLNQDGSLSLTPGAGSYYAANTLNCTKTTDEESNEVLEFKDMQGRVVCKKVKATGNTYAQTYYLYNDFGNLAIVVQPEGVKEIISILNQQ